MGADGRDAVTSPALALLCVLWDGDYAFELLRRVIIHIFSRYFLTDRNE